MSQVNYIRHMNGLFDKLWHDHRLNPSHISIYLALFKFWNLNRFHNPFSVARSDVMKLAKVKSPNTYSKCLKELMLWEYIVYKPSYNPYKGSLFSLVNFCAATSSNNAQAVTYTSSKNGQALSNTTANSAQALIPSKTYKLNSINERENTLSLNLIIQFFISEKSNKEEAQKFWNHYESNGWLIGGKTPMVDWQASARNWIIRSKDLNTKTPTQKRDYLHTSSKKNYNEPL